ncbi:hypothetical protein DFH06DRAFT_1251413 [Mycena polygramma]|nr:hypothetical protein DFH06DRAFT_1251413 [Mycena polygramma]
MSAQTCDPKATQMDSSAYDLAHNPQSTPSSTLTDSEADEISDDSASPSPQHRGARRVLSRVDRALCRVVVERYGIPNAILRDHFRCSLSTINKAVANSYVKKDVDVAKDNDILEGDPNYTATLKKLLDDKYRAESSSSIGDNESDSKSPKRQGRRVKKVETPEAKAKSPYRLRSAPSKPMSTTSVSSAPSVGATPDPPAVPAISEAHFLLAFVASIPLADAWHTALEKEGFTQAKLRGMTKMASSDVEQLITKIFPEMMQLDRLLLVAAIKALNMES